MNIDWIIIAGLILVIVFLLWAFTSKIKQLNIYYASSLKAERADAVKKSKSVIRGQISEQMLPIFPDFPYDISEVKFLGNPVDFILFKGMGKVAQNIEGAEIEVVIAEVKTGNAQPTKIQRAVRKALKEGRFRFEQWRVNENRSITIK